MNTCRRIAAVVASVALSVVVVGVSPASANKDTGWGGGIIAPITGADDGGTATTNGRDTGWGGG